MKPVACTVISVTLAIQNEDFVTEKLNALIKPSKSNHGLAKYVADQVKTTTHHMESFWNFTFRNTDVWLQNEKDSVH